MENKAQTNWLSRPTGILFIVMTAFTFQVHAQDGYFGLSGNLYLSGGIFSINTDGSNLQSVFQFNQSTSGSHPFGNLIEHGGLLYGTTQVGPTSYGTLFSFDPYTNTQTILYNLNGGSDGSYQ